MHSGHQALQDSKVVVDNLGEGSQAVSGAGSVRYDLEMWLDIKICKDIGPKFTNLHVLVVSLVVDAHHEHGSVSGRGGDDDLLRPALVVGTSLLEGRKYPGALHHVHGAHGAPWDGGGVALGEHGDGPTVHHQLPVSGGDLALVLAMGGVIPDTSSLVKTQKGGLSLAQSFMLQCHVSVNCMTT